MKAIRYDSPEADIGTGGGPELEFGELFDAYAAPLHRYLARRVGQEVRGLRATSRADAGSTQYQPSHDGMVANRVDAQAMARLIAPAIADLSDGDRDVLLLTSWAELTTVEVADALGIPVGTVRSRLHRIRRHLRTTIALEAITND